MLPLGMRKASASSCRVPRKIASTGRTLKMNARLRTASDARGAGAERIAAIRAARFRREDLPILIPPNLVPAGERSRDERVVRIPLKLSCKEV